MTISAAYLIATLISQGWSPPAAASVTAACPAYVHSEWVGLNGTVYGPPCWVYYDEPEPLSWVVSHEALHVYIWMHRSGIGSDADILAVCLRLARDPCPARDLTHYPHRLLTSVNGDVSKLPVWVRTLWYGWSMHQYRQVLPLVVR